MRDTTIYRHIALLVLLAAIWSSSFTLIKVAVGGVPPTTLVAARLLIAAVLLYGFLHIRGKRLPLLGWANRREWGMMFMLGVMGNSLPFFLISWGEVAIGSGLAAILIAVMPLVTLVLAHFFTQSDRMTVPKFIGLCVGMSGIIMLIGPSALQGLGGQTLHQLAVAGAAVCYAIMTVLVRRLPAGGDPLQRSTAVVICAALQMLPIALFVDAPWTLSPTGGEILANIYLGIFPTGLAAIMQFHLVAVRGTTFFAAVNYLIPCMGVLWGVLFLGEQVTTEIAMALGIILTGIAVANVRLRARTRA